MACKLITFTCCISSLENYVADFVYRLILLILYCNASVYVYIYVWYIYLNTSAQHSKLSSMFLSCDLCTMSHDITQLEENFHSIITQKHTMYLCFYSCLTNRLLKRSLYSSFAWKNIWQYTYNAMYTLFFLINLRLHRIILLCI